MNLDYLLDRDPMPAVHREWLLAALGSEHDYDPSYAGVRGEGLQDWEWCECEWMDEPPAADTWIKPQLCKVCNNGATDEELGSKLKWKHRERLGALRSFDYLRLPVAIAEAVETVKHRQRVGYWVGRCHRCKSVWWIADDRREKRQVAA